jgi:hypothetical protein
VLGLAVRGSFWGTQCVWGNVNVQARDLQGVLLVIQVPSIRVVHPHYCAVSVLRYGVDDEFDRALNINWSAHEVVVDHRNISSSHDTRLEPGLPD